MKRKYQVGGVIYEILKLNKPSIEKLDIKPIKSMIHDPITIEEEVVIDGYKPQYQFNKDSNDSNENPMLVTHSEKPPVTKLVLDRPVQVESTDVVESPIVTGNQFHSTLYNAFIRAGVNENIAKFMVAQDSLETGDGKYHAGRYNYGNITAGSSWKGSTTAGGDKDAKGRKITQNFRNYDSIDHYALDKKALLSSSRYKCSMTADTIEQYARCVKAGGYAEDPNYEKKLIEKYYSLYGKT